MRCTRDDLLESARNRPRRSRLMTADRYVRSMEACFTGGNCPTHLFQSASPGEWERSLKEAEARLVWTDPAATLDAHVRRQPEGSQRLTDGAVMDFEAIITTTRRDRDQDVMESSGAVVDPSAVLLWQHVPLLPIGRLLRVTERTDARVKARLSIADTELGRDAAVLAEFGALKVSHGFEPLEFEPLPDAGWHIKRFEIYEISLVSVPSNRDAVITALSRNKLRCPLMKEWASGVYRRRAVQGLGAALEGTGVHAKGITPEGSELCACQRRPTGAPSGSGDDSCATSGARFVARAARCTTTDLPTLKDIHGAVAQIIERLELEHQATATRSFRQLMQC